jgi:hypothetical protein
MIASVPQSIFANVRVYDEKNGAIDQHRPEIMNPPILCLKD